MQAGGFWEHAPGGKPHVHAALQFVKHWAFYTVQAILCGEFVISLTCCGSDMTSGPTAVPIIGNIYVLLS